MTLQKRREIAAMAKEHDARVDLVRTLQDTVRQKDELMSVRLSGMAHDDVLKYYQVLTQRMLKYCRLLQCGSVRSCMAEH